ncbi:MAG: hypothetical protein FWG87_12760 [Defluviitaleaceae bacterium]|nr:hypothetical protein [Defluviitaleaceae bacterium]
MDYIIYAISLFCLLTASATANTLETAKDFPVIEATAEIKEYEAVPMGTPPDKFADYASIIEEYRRFAGYSIEGYDRASVQDIEWYSRGWLGSVIISTYIDTPRTKNDYSYAIVDLNGNGSPELILAMGDSIVCAVFSMVDGKPKLLHEFWQRYTCEIDTAGTIRTSGYGGAGWTDFEVYTISQDELVRIDAFGLDGWNQVANEQSYYRMADGTKKNITESEFEALYALFSDTLHSTRNSRIEFVPLFD